MRKIILNLAVSLDGYIEGPNGEYDWCFTDQDYGMSEFYNQIDSVFLGRKSYQLTESMGSSDMPGVPKFQEYIFSSTLEKVKPGAILLKGVIREEIENIKSQPGKNIWLFGGASLTNSLMKHELIDEFRLSIHPILLGKGRPLFESLSSRVNLILTNVIKYDSGLVTLVYNLK